MKASPLEKDHVRMLRGDGKRGLRRPKNKAFSFSWGVSASHGVPGTPASGKEPAGMPNAALVSAEQSVGGLLVTLPGSRCKVLGTLQGPSLLASCHLLLPQALVMPHCLVAGCCMHAPPMLCTPLADKRFFPCQGNLLSPIAFWCQTPWPDRHRFPQQHHFYHPWSTRWHRLGLPGSRGLVPPPSCHHCHVSCVPMQPPHNKPQTTHPITGTLRSINYSICTFSLCD